MLLQTQIKMLKNWWSFILLRKENVIMEGISFTAFPFGVVCPSIDGSFAVSHLLVNVPVVLAEFRRSLIVAWARVAQLFPIDLIKVGLSLLIVELRLGSALVVRQ
jgi:hypothetical protein